MQEGVFLDLAEPRGRMEELKHAFVSLGFRFCGHLCLEHYGFAMFCICPMKCLETFGQLYEKRKHEGIIMECWPACLKLIWRIGDETMWGFEMI